MTAVAQAAAPDAAPLRHRLMLPLLLVGQAMAAVDTSIVNVAAPAIRRDLGISGALLQLVIAGYVLAYAVLLVTGARLGDDHGYRRVFVLGVAIFTAASLACGLAPDTAVLIVARVVQGVGAALIVPQVLSLIQREFAGAERARAVGYYSMILGLAVVIGQLLGGAIVTVDVLGLSWRPAFLINVPVGLALLLSARGVLPAARGALRRRLDLAGVTVLTLAMVLVVVPLTFGHELGWPAWTWLSLLLGLIGLVAFVRLEEALARRGGSPLLDLAVLRGPGVKPGLVVLFIGMGQYGGLVFTVAVYLQSGLGYSPLASGLVFTAYASGFAAANLNWSKLPERLLLWTPTTVLLTLAAVDALLAGLLLARGWTPALALPLLLVAGTCHGLAFGPVVSRLATRIEPAFAPALSGLVTTATQLSIVVGIATLGTIYLAAAKAGPPGRAVALVACAVALAALAAAGCAARLATARRLGVAQ